MTGNEQFVLFFTKNGEPHITRLAYDSKSGTYKAKPIPRDSELAGEALSSPAGQARQQLIGFRFIRDNEKFCPWCGRIAQYYNGVVDCSRCEAVTKLEAVT